MKLSISKVFSWHWVHSFLGLWCSIILFFIFLTGTLSVLATEIDWLFKSEMRVSADGRDKLSLDQVFDSVRKAYPEHQVVRVNRFDESWIADHIAIPKLGPVWVDPYTAEVKGMTSSLSFHEVISELHKRLFIPGRPGLMVVTVFSLAMTGSLIAGIFLLPRFWKSFVIKPRFSGSRRALYSDLHRLLGAWSIPFVALFCATTLYYFAETLNLDAPPYNNGTETAKREKIYPVGMDGAQFARAIEIARGIYPDLDVKTVIMPNWKTKPIVIEGDLDAILVRKRANAVYLHPDTLEVIKHHRGEELTVHQRISEAVDPLHWGFWGGLPSKILWFVFGVFLTILPALGAAIYAKRMGVRIAKIEGTPVSDWQVYWRGMGLGKWLCLLLVAVGFALMFKRMFAG